MASAAASSSQARPVVKFFCVATVDGDVDCLFHALAPFDGYDGQALRIDVAKFLEENALAQPGFEEEWLQEAMKLRDYKWGGHTAMAAYSLMKSRRIIVHTRQPGTGAPWLSSSTFGAPVPGCRVWTMILRLFMSMVDTDHKQHFAGRTFLQAMEGRQFEWAVIENVVSDAATDQCLKDPENWNLLHPDFVEDMVGFTDAHVDWILRRFIVFLTDMPSGFGQCFECHIEGRFTPDTYAYRLEFFDEEEHLTSLHHLRLGQYAVALREVPPHLLVNCNLDIGTSAWKAVFTTLAGRGFLRVEEPLPQHGLLCVSYLLEICRRAARCEGLLRSRNQEVRLLFNGSATELPEQAILWSRGVPFP